MDNLKQIVCIIAVFWKSISKRRRIQIITLQFFNIITSLCELIAIASIFPFISSIIAPIEFQKKLHNKFSFIPYFHSINDFVLFIVLVFIILNLLSGFVRIISLLLNSKISFYAGSDLGKLIYKNSLFQNYEYHTFTNSSNIISVIASKSGTIITNALMPTFNIISSFFLFIFIFVSLLAYNVKLTSIMVFVFIVIYYIILKITKPKLLKEGKITAIETDLLMRNLQESFGGIREIILNNSHNYQINKYNTTERKLRQSQSNSHIIVNLPKYIIEPSGLIVLALIAYYLYSKNNSNAQIISILAVLTMSIQRLLPVLQQIYSNWSTLTNSLASLKDINLMLELNNSNIEINDSLKFSWYNSIKLSNVFFKYTTRNNFILNNINLEIKKGEIVGFVGKSGEGKSTIIDLISGLIFPTKGVILIDDQPLKNTIDFSLWKNEISVVSQRIFLLDKTLAENVAFGIERDKIDYVKLNQAIILAKLENTIERLPLGIETIIGERGVQLSGGQLQRIGLARAFYKNASLLILDEATSALDRVTEKEIIETIFSFKGRFTIILITHNSSNLKICDKIYEVKNGEIYSL